MAYLVRNPRVPIPATPNNMAFTPPAEVVSHGAMSPVLSMMDGMSQHTQSPLHAETGTVSFASDGMDCSPPATFATPNMQSATPLPTYALPMAAPPQTPPASAHSQYNTNNLWDKYGANVAPQYAADCMNCKASTYAEQNYRCQIALLQQQKFDANGRLTAAQDSLTAAQDSLASKITELERLRTHHQKLQSFWEAHANCNDASANSDAQQGDTERLRQENDGLRQAAVLHQAEKAAWQTSMQARDKILDAKTTQLKQLQTSMQAVQSLLTSCLQGAGNFTLPEDEDSEDDSEDDASEPAQPEFIKVDQGLRALLDKIVGDNKYSGYTDVSEVINRYLQKNGIPADRCLRNECREKLTEVRTVAYCPARIESKPMVEASWLCGACKNSSIQKRKSQNSRRCGRSSSRNMNLCARANRDNMRLWLINERDANRHASKEGLTC